MLPFGASFGGCDNNLPPASEMYALVHANFFAGGEL
jgi:hypothetical protein